MTQEPRRSEIQRRVPDPYEGIRIPDYCTTIPTIVAVVATHNRSHLLARRSLKSVAKQTRPPDMLIVVDDSDSGIRHYNKAVVAEFTKACPRTVYMENARTPGAAGAWNTALAYLQAVAPLTFVAILDDDDSWAPKYLQQCEKTVLERNLDMVASGLIYHKFADQEGRLLDAPDQLTVKDLLVRNTNIQGSNMFVRLRGLLEAGGFDEAMASTTDRDICIRLADLKTIRYGALTEHLVHHYAESDRPRLSTPGTDVKRTGLSYFFRKYRGRMSKAERSAFVRRSRRLFHCDPSENTTALRPTAPDSNIDSLAAAGISRPRPTLRPTAPDPGIDNARDTLDLVVGAITSPDVTLVTNMMNSLVRKIVGRNDVTLKLVLLENGGHEIATRNALREAINQASRQGLDITLKTLEQQAADAAAGVFSASRKQLAERKSIAVSRTMLQHYLFLQASSRAAAVVWILDDDVVLDGLECGPAGTVGNRNVDYVLGIRQLKETGASVVLCQETGDAPVPALSCIRTQLVDLYHNLHHLAMLCPNDPFPNLSNENRISRLANHNYYYDLSSIETDHLERPFWYEASRDDLHTEQAFNEMISRLPDILSGIQVFRPLARVEPDAQTSIVVPSITRGPATLIFDVHALRDFPNVSPVINGMDVRRSDMVWSLLNQFVGGRDVVRAQLPIRHVRDWLPTNPDFNILFHDIMGYAFYSSLQDVFTSKAQMNCRKGKYTYGRNFLNFNEQEIESAVSLFRKYSRERAHAFELNFIRIKGLLSALRPFCQLNTISESAPWWLKSSEYAASVCKLRRFVESVDSIYTDERLNDFMRHIADVDAEIIVHFLRNLAKVVNRYRANTPLPIDALYQNADEYIRSEFKTGPLTHVGTGEEGVVLTDGHLAYKYFHHWNLRDRERRIVFLQSLVGKLAGCKTLPPLLEVRQKGEHVVAVYAYNAGIKYNGGHLNGLLTLLRECRQVGITCNNVHPDNLLVTPSGLMFIDYGADIVPFNDPEFEQMCRRAFLTYRFPHHPDLKRMMSRALDQVALAELTGLKQFRNALDPRELDTLFYQPMARLIASRQYHAVLDYGCGNGHMVKHLIHNGVKVIGYDRDPMAIEKCRNRAGPATYGGTELRAKLLANSVRFDMVVCSRVLCTIADNSEFEAVLRDLRQFVTDSGAVYVAVCNPFYLAATSTELTKKHLPNDFRYEHTFPYSKTVAINGSRRMEIHRSYAAYRRAFGRAGLLVTRVREFDGTDTLSFLPASEHLVFQLSPAPIGGPRISLLIKTCLMEWRVIERLVRHQVGQLENPIMFTEKVIVVDPSEMPLSRRYDRLDRKAHRAAMDRLLRDGVVDRVVYAPSDPEVIRSTYKKWFGIESIETHSANGQQLFATLFGFDSCIADYVLQLDSDMLIYRTDRDHDYLAEMVDVLRSDPKALFVPLSICRAKMVPYTAKGSEGDWRVEVRGCLYDRQRLQSILPVSNMLESNILVLAWHRAFDRFIAASDYHSYRGGNPRTASIHVTNDRKAKVEEWLDIIGAVERGYVPEAQLGRADLVGSSKDWLGPKRSEPFVFVICGHNVEHGRFKRCFQSLMAQQSNEWGAVVVDDASTNGFGDYAKILLADHADRITLIHNEKRRGILYNTWSAITRVCNNLETIIVTLDANDALIGNSVLERVRVEYDNGADATVGSMFRVDKVVSYQASFNNPRRRESNVWQHLRTFKKYLFDSIAVDDFKIDGEWIDYAADWAFMVPIIEMAANPQFIPDPLCLHDPATTKDEKGQQERDLIINRILSKTPYAKLK